jgi:DNA methylase
VTEPVDPAIGQAHLFEPPAPEHLTLSDRFLVPPFTVLEARAGYWQDRKRDWMLLGIQPELGVSRAEAYLVSEGQLDVAPAPAPADNGKARTSKAARDQARYDAFASGKAGTTAAGRDDQLVSKAFGTSVFDPVVCEIAYRWYSPPGGLVYDPFAGGSVRGVVAACLGRRYVGVDLRPEQIAANEEQADVIGKARAWLDPPTWVVGDSRDTPAILGDQRADFVFSCPPYYDLEQYSDDPRDLSNAGSYAAFLDGYQQIIEHCVAMLKPDRFACFVVGELRAADGGYHGLVPDTIVAFEEAGARYYNEAILVTTVGSLPIRTSRTFGPGRKLGKSHQNMLVFVKGDGRAAADACGLVPEVALEYGGAVWRADATLALPATGDQVNFYDEEER